MALRKIHNTWYVYYREDGKIITRSLKVHDKEQAVVFEKRFMDQLRARRAMQVIIREFPEFKPPEVPQTPQEVAIHQRGGIKLKDMLSELDKIHKVSPTNRRAIVRFVEAMPVKYADQVTPQMALQYLENNYTKGRNYKAFNNNRGILHKMFRLLLVRTGLQQSPFERIPCRTVKNVESHRPITDAEFLRIFAEAAEPFRTAACLGFYAGADISTAFGIPGSAVDLEQRIINWRRPKTGTQFICGIHPELMQMLKRLNFKSNSDKPILPKTGSTVRNVYFRELFNRLGIVDTKDGKASFHSFRTSFFTRCDAANLHRRTTSLAGGHTDDRMNDLYSHDISAAHEVETLPSLGITARD